MVRSKVIEKIELIPQNPTDEKASRVLVNLQTSAGTYVKEFMHGDEGRTVPCLHSILECTGATVVYLDVTKIHLDWPPAITSKGIQGSLLGAADQY
jgi:tRNA pseudouridine synthase 10